MANLEKEEKFVCKRKFDCFGALIEDAEEEMGGILSRVRPEEEIISAGDINKVPALGRSQFFINKASQYQFAEPSIVKSGLSEILDGTIAKESIFSCFFFLFIFHELWWQYNIKVDPG